MYVLPCQLKALGKLCLFGDSPKRVDPNNFEGRPTTNTATNMK